MLRGMKIMGKHLASLLIALAAITNSSPTAAQDKSTGKDTPKAKIGQDKGKPDPAKVKEQVAKAQQYYKDALEVETVPVHETAHFVVVGQYPKRPVELIGGELEQGYAKACKVLELQTDPGPWEGKMVVFVLADAKVYPKMVRLTQRRKADEDESASHSTSNTLPHVVVCPGKAPGDLGVGATASTHACAILIDLKAKTRVPDWMSEGFGRAATLQGGPPATLAAERRKASAFLAQNKRTVNDVMADNLKPEELIVLRASLLDYLAFSGRTSKFLPIIQGFPPDGNLDMAFKKAGLTREDLSSNWFSYARSFK